MRRALAFLVSLLLANISLLEAASRPLATRLNLQDYDNTYEPFSPEQLDNLVAPIALYPDPLLSQVLVAATFVDDIDEAARWVRANGAYGIDDQPWDVSVRAVAHYPAVIYMMADKMDWTISLGQAYVNQSTDVMLAIQRLRHMAHSVGNLYTTPQQQVLIQDDYISIVPYSPTYIYVPVYDPYICYYRRPSWGAAITFGVGFLIGAWLNRDCDWHQHRVFYHGWRGAGWIERSRPRIHITNIYVNNRYENVTVNRNVMYRNVNVNNIERNRYVHRDVNYRNIQQNNERINRRNNVRPLEQPGRPPVNNKIINRNIDTTNPRYDRYRGHESGPGKTRPPEPQPQPQAGHPTPPMRPTPPAQAPRTAPTPAPRPAPHIYERGQGTFDPRATSQRGQSSRQQANPPKPTPRPMPAPRAQGKAPSTPKAGSPPRGQSKSPSVPRGGDRRKP